MMMLRKFWKKMKVIATAFYYIGFAEGYVRAMKGARARQKFC